MHIKTLVNTQSKWLQSYESDIINILQVEINKQFEIDMAVIQRLVDMISDKILNSEVIREEWLITNDAIAINKNRRRALDPPDLHMPEPIPFYNNKLNTNQQDSLMRFIETMTRNGKIIIEDLEEFVDRCQSKIGPFASSIERDGKVFFDLMAIPKLWRDEISQTSNPTDEDTEDIVITTFREQILMTSEVVCGFIERNKIAL